MTENKRFVFDPSIYHFTDTATDKTYCEYNLDKVVDLLNSLSDENEQLKESLKNKMESDAYWEQKATERVNKLEKENEQLKQEKPFLKIHNDYFIQYGDDRELFSMHKPSDIRSLMYLINRENGYSELQSQYNDLERVE